MQTESQIVASVGPPSAKHFKFSLYEWWIGFLKGQFLFAALFLIAVIRVCSFSIAFPFFTTIDEEQQFDTIHKYARGYVLQRELPTLDREVAEKAVLYGSPEYVNRKEIVYRHVPWWCYAKGEVLPERADSSVTYFATMRNLEVHSPPIYYMVAALWYNLGKLAYGGIYLLYWTRLLNVLAYGALLLLSYVFVKTIYPANFFLRVSVPLMLAVFPQDVFYSLNPDVLFAPWIVFCMILLVQLYRNEFKGYGFFVLTGISVAAALLMGFSNWVILGLIVAATYLRLKNFRWGSGFNSEVRKLVALWLALGLPVSYWLIRNYISLGDWTGSKAKREALHWSVQPASQILHHPIFTFDGMYSFLQVLVQTFWRGEIIWHTKTMRSPEIELFYLGSSLLFLAAFVLSSMRSNGEHNGEQRAANYICLYLVVSSVVFLAVLSLPFDFGDTYYPSRKFPFFASGRIIVGTLVPFLVLYLTGLQALVARISKRLDPLLIVLAIAGWTLVSEVWTRHDVFQSKYNLFAFLAHRSCGF